MQESTRPSVLSLLLCFLWGLLATRLVGSLTGMLGMQLENLWSPTSWIFPLIMGSLSAYGYYLVKTKS